MAEGNSTLPGQRGCGRGPQSRGQRPSKKKGSLTKTANVELPVRMAHAVPMVSLVSWNRQKVAVKMRKAQKEA